MQQLTMESEGLSTITMITYVSDNACRHGLTFFRSESSATQQFHILASGTVASGRIRSGGRKARFSCRWIEEQDTCNLISVEGGQFIDAMLSWGQTHRLLEYMTALRRGASIVSKEAHQNR